MKYTVEYFVNRGMSEKFARYYVSCIETEMRHPLYDKKIAEWSLSRGFLFSSAKAYGITEANYMDFLSDEDYYKTWPLNNWTRIWVDDKMTLKYMLEGTEFSDIMPKYYFYSTPNGLRELIDNPFNGSQDIATLVESVKCVGDIACKPNNGTASVGFYRLSFEDGNFCLNGTPVGEKGIAQFVESHPNYIFTEYLRPEKRFAEVQKLIHTLRLVVLNTEGNNPRIIGGYLRFGTANHGESNHMSINDDCKSDFDFVTEINVCTGHIGSSKSVYFDRVEDTPIHPDSKVEVDWTIPNWTSIVNTIHGISKHFFGLTCIGFDLGITDDGLKLMEINTHPGIKYMQISKSLYSEPEVKEFFQAHIKA